VRLGGATSGSRSGVADTRLGVKAVIRALGLRLVSYRGHFIVGTS